jgi:hypothetical protein
VNKEQFLNNSFLETDLHPTLWALFLDAQAHWEQAHQVVQNAEGQRDFDRIHAYLHFKEGDRFNAQWWYRNLGLDYPTHSVEKEWEILFDLFQQKYPILL